MNRKDILDFLAQNKLFLQQKYNVSKIGLFGSYAVDKQTDNSDIDILVSMPSSFDNYYDLKEFLEANLHHKVDLGLDKSIRELIKKSIEKEIIYV